jgi:hypothetical protein
MVIKSRNKYSSKKTIKKTKNLKPRERRYCSCLMQVRPKIKNPYGICTNSVYNLQNTRRTKLVKCSKYYDFQKYNLKILRAYAKEKSIKLTQGGKYLSKKALVSKLAKYSNQKK